MAREAEFLDLSCNKQLKCPNDLQDFKQITSFFKKTGTPFTTTDKTLDNAV